MSTFRCEFLGCKVNQYDAERARRRLLEAGWTEVEEGESLLLLAGCTVTATAARRGRQAARAALRADPEAQVAVLGCVSEDDRRFYDGLGHSVTFLPSARDDGFLEGSFDRLVRSASRETPGTTAAPRRYRPRRTRASLKVEDGCDLKCAYCIIPSVRGGARSRDPDEVVEELRNLVAEGTREVVLTGIHHGHYGRRTEWTLPGLIRRMLEVPGAWRLRLSSLEVTELGPELMELLQTEPRLVPHLHLPLQSGSPRILRQMRRPYTAERFRRTIRRLRERLPDPALTTDVIVGFPGESDEDFAETLAVCDEARFSKIHVFPFSARQGTDAEQLPERVHGDVVRERKAALFELEARHREESLRRRVGSIAEVVLERANEAGAVGTDERYHRTILGPGAHRPGDLVRAKVTGVRDGALEAIAVGAGG